MNTLNALNSLLVIGCGKMGGAVLDGVLNKGMPSEKIYVVEPDAGFRDSIRKKGVHTAGTISEFYNISPDVILLAVKPFIIKDIISSIKPFTDKGSILLSIIAGRPVGWFEENLEPGVSVVRAMPNTPACVGRGMTGLYANPAVSTLQKSKIESILNCCGETVWLKNESQMDAVTAVSGSGPAYVFYLAEALTQAAESLGLSKEAAAVLARSTVCGAAELLYQSPETPETLRRNVTTPNGTTAAALEILMNKATGLAPLMTEAVKAAEKRSQELAKV